MMREAASQEDYSAAGRLGDTVISEAAHAHDPQLAKQARAGVAAVRERAQAYEAFQNARAALKQDPKDPAANLAVGRYLCLVKGDWEQGFPMLALGSDKSLKELAAKEIQAPVSADDKARLGDAWWDLAENEESATTSKQLRSASRVLVRIGFAWADRPEPRQGGETPARVVLRRTRLLFGRAASRPPKGKSSPPKEMNRSSRAISE